MKQELIMTSFYKVLLHGTEAELDPLAKRLLGVSLQQIKKRFQP